MNYLRSRFQKSTSYDHERGRSSSRGLSSSIGSSAISNNTDKLLKDIRTKRLRAATAAQSVSDNLTSSVIKREKSIPRNDDNNSYLNQDLDPYSLLSNPRVPSSSKTIQYQPIEIPNSPNIFSSTNTYSISKRYGNHATPYTSSNLSDDSNAIRPFWSTKADDILNDVSFNYKLDTPPSDKTERNDAPTSKWFVKYQSEDDTKSHNAFNSDSKSAVLPISASSQEKSNEKLITCISDANKSSEECSVSVKLVLNQNKSLQKTELPPSRNNDSPISDTNGENAELNRQQTDKGLKNTSSEVSNYRRRRPETRTESNDHPTSNNGATRRRRRQEDTKVVDNSNSNDNSVGSSKPLSFRRRRRQDDGEGSDDANPFTKRNFEREKKKSFDEQEKNVRSSTASQPTKDEKGSQVKPMKGSTEQQLDEADNEHDHAKQGQAEKEKEDTSINKSQSETQNDLPEMLNCIEIKSAAQWKAMSDLMSLNFESVKEEGEEELDDPEKTDEKEVASKTPIVIKPSEDDSKREITYKLPAWDTTVDPDGFTRVEAKQLRLVCWRVKPWKENKSRRLFSSQFGEQWGVDCDEVFQGLFIGDKASASNIQFLKRYGITHVLNTAEGKDEGLVDLSTEYFEGSGIKYLGFPLWDHPNCNLIPYFGCASEYIEDAILSGGKCLVNCQMGVSRSASCALSYMMIKEGMCVKEALTLFRKSRDTRPNDGFLDQLVELDNDLRRFRDYEMPMRIKLSTLKDLELLPKPWNYEFWTKSMSEEEVEMKLVNIGEPFIPQPPSTILSPGELSQFDPSTNTSRYTSRATSNLVSKRNSFRQPNNDLQQQQDVLNSDRYEKSNEISQVKSRNTSRPRSEIAVVKSTEGDETESEWEWVWEDESGNEFPFDETKEKLSLTQQKDPPLVPPEPPVLTIERLEEVKEIIEKPEERWRTMWRKSLDSSAPSRDGTTSISSVNSVFSGTSLAFSNQYTKKRDNVIQAGIDKSDPLSIVKVSSAKQWKAISKNLTINFNDIELEDADSKNVENETIENATTEENDLSSSIGLDAVGRPSTPVSFNPTKVQQLRMICWRIKPWEYPKERGLFHSLLGSGWGVDCDEVYPNLFIGDEASARNIRFLKKMGITHVLNTAEGIWTDCSFVDLNDDYYLGSGITYQGLQLWDHTCVRILPYLGCADEFIAAGMKNGGKVLVHCQMGVSRSSTAAISYMMLTKGWKVDEVLRLFRKRRDVRPNDFYLTQLVELDNDLRKLRECGIPRKIKLHQLKDIDFLPKPWHYQFWESMPTDETLPFSLSCVCEPRPDMQAILRKLIPKQPGKKCPQGDDCKAKISQKRPTFESIDFTSNNHSRNLDLKNRRERSGKSRSQSKRQSKCSNNSTRSTSSWEWEYYEDSDEIEDDLEDLNTRRNSNETFIQNDDSSCIYNLRNED